MQMLSFRKLIRVAAAVIKGPDIATSQHVFDVKMLMKAVKLEFLTSMIWKGMANLLHFSLNCLMMLLELSTPRGCSGSLILLVLGAPTSLVDCIVYTSILSIPLKTYEEGPEKPRTYL